MYALDSKLQAPKNSQRSAHERFVHARGVHWEALVDRILLLKAAKPDISFVCLDEEHTLCYWQALALKENSL